MLGVVMEGYREKAFGIILNGWQPEEAAKVREAVTKYSDGRHRELMAGPDEIFIYIIFGNCRKTPEQYLAEYLVELTKSLAKENFSGPVSIRMAN
jgi:hypothetical protein